MDPSLKAEVSKCFQNSMLSWLLVAVGPCSRRLLCAKPRSKKGLIHQHPCPFTFPFGLLTWADHALLSLLPTADSPTLPGPCGLPIHKPPHVPGLQCPFPLNTLEIWLLLLTVLTNTLGSCVLHCSTGSELQEGRLGVHSPGTAPASRPGLPVGSCGLK